jgi:hypothetical protein
VQISWQASANERYSAVFAYRVKLQKSDGTFIEHYACDGKDPAVFAALTCSVSMASLLAAPFNLVEGQRVNATVEALN